MNEDNLQYWRERQNTVWKTCDEALIEQLKHITKKSHDEFKNFSTTMTMAVPKPSIDEKLQCQMENVRNAYDDSEDEEEETPSGLQDVDAHGNDIG